jgi:hypothetical protein
VRALVTPGALAWRSAAPGDVVRLVRVLVHLVRLSWCWPGDACTWRNSRTWSRLVRFLVLPW